MKKTKLSIVISTLLGVVSVNAFAQAGRNVANDIYRYVDESGKVIYTDKYPKQKDLEVGVLSKKTGIMKNKSELEAAAASELLSDEERTELALAKLKEEEQIKKDQALLNTYSNSAEIEKLKKYELEQIDKTIQNDISNIATSKKRIEEIKKEMTKNPSVKATYENEINRINDNIIKFNSNLEKNRKMYVEREQKYNEEKDRFIAVMKLLDKEKEKKKPN